MKYTMTVSPDFPLDHIAGWYIFNTWLQVKLGINIHLELYDNFDLQREAIERGEIDIIYANPFDASMLIREKGFTAIVKPHARADEVVIAAAIDSSIEAIEDLNPETRLAKTNDPDVNMIGMIMLEPANLNAKNIIEEQVDTHILIAKRIFSGHADIGFFLKDSYDSLSQFVRSQLQVLVSSQIDDITHTLLIGPNAKDLQEEIQSILLNMQDLEKGQGVLDSMGIKSWDIQTQEDAEFMIDLMDTLVD
ncbi:MAG: PhnD/SsuA/transferrin family substrate-binding protein [Thiotrichaceae bacterium]|nr:PhnD/SsuA/transferrin family substrate-binding protein [Thiotrichaceae bacterium]